MNGIVILIAAILIAVVLIDTFEVMILPRRIAHAFRPARLFYRTSWRLWRSLASIFRTAKWRNGFLSVFGPLSVFLLVICWATGLIFGFALLHWSLGTSLSTPRNEPADFAAYVYFSGTTFFTLGYGDMVPSGPWGRALSIAEAGLGFGFLAVVISFLPVLYQSFSRREVTISMFDARAGSPPSAGELLRRVADGRGLADIRSTLGDWERWSAELLESHLSYPMLGYYRSQHDNQSWIAALTTILDTSASIIAIVESAENYQARLTFAMARHAAVDLSLISQTPPRSPAIDRLPSLDFNRFYDRLNAAGLPVRDRATAEASLLELRALYEPFVHSLASYFEFALPSFEPRKEPIDNWQTSAWMKRSPGLARLSPDAENEHFN